MAIKKFSPNDIPDLNQDWGQDINDELLRPFSGRAVQKLIREQLVELRDTKFGHVTYEAGNITFYDVDGGTVIATLALSGTVYTIELDSSDLSTFTVLTSDLAKVLTVTPSSKEGSIGSELSEFIEDYTWIASVDSGGGFVNIANGVCSNGNSFSTDVRPYLNVGINRIRFTVTGVTSNQTKSLVFSANLTSLTLNVLHNWQKPWIENEPYYVQGIYFSGNMQKILNVRIDDDNDKVFTQTFSASTSYVGSPYIFNLTSHFPGTTGIHKIDVWITGTGVTTKHFVFDVMCVRTVDRLTAKLICINDLKPKVFNYEDQELFKFATYGTSEATFNLTAHADGADYPVIVDQQVNVVSEDKVPYSIRLEIPTELQAGVSLSIDASVDSSAVTKTTSVDNSNAFAPVSDATFYMNSSLRNNGSADREMILNNLIDPTVSGYPAVWTGFSWENDGWGTDPQSVKCLSVQAGSSIVSENFKPLSVLGAGQSLTVEWKFKVDSVSDYNTPIMTFMSDDVYNPSTTNGVIVFPTKVLVLTSSNRNEIQQSVNFGEGEQLHFALVFQSGYGTTGRNLCRIYINGIQQSVFEYDGSSSFGNGSLKLGQTSTDLYLYMFRAYNGVALESDGILKNWLNALTETMDYSRHGIRMDNDIFDGININYDLVKARGFNTMVVEMAGDIAIPSLSNNVKAKSSVSVEYANNPEWNFRITNAPIDGQGTTSKRYAKWNLRWKLAEGTDASIWHYADGSVSTTKGWFDGASNHPKVSRITAKKNIASSSQGHKMGAVKMYDDLYKELGLNHDLLPGARVSVYQYPVMGFQKHADGSYTFIGLYTIGPDKGDSGTFGYDTSIFPELLSIEGPNHAPLGTRFIHPWIDMAYDGDEETLTFGGQEGWDTASYNDGKYSTNEGVLTLFENEWKPAYDIVYFCSTYLRSIAETGLTLGEINSDILGFRNASNLLTTRKNEVVTLYDESYNLVYYRISTNQYEILAGHDVRTYLAGYLVNMTDPTTQELIVARKAKFVAEMENYYDIESLLYHENFLFLIGASDNHAKNFYPFKLKSLAEGGRWQFRQDDMDTILATDNNGNPTKPYYVEPGDLTINGTDIYQGSSSSLWTLVREVFQVRLRAMMTDMINGLVAIASRRGLQKSYKWQTVYAMFDYYFWRHSAKYFPERAYAEDTNFGYVSVWAKNPGATYNGVYPLTQALGTQLEAEQHWALRRILYVFSKYSIGGFTGSTDDGLNSIEFTPGQAYTFNLTPAINMYPSGNLGGGTNIVGARTAAGEVCQIVATSDGTTTYYLKGLDWLTSLGDLSNLVLTSRGGVSTINFSVKSKRLRFLKVGDANIENVAFNATALDVQGDGIEEVDVRNVTSILSPVNLSYCPRLKVARLEGSSVPTVLLPVGSKINHLTLPASIQNIYLNGLPLLNDEGLNIPAEAMVGIRGLYISNCPNISHFTLLLNLLNTANHGLRFVTMFLGSVQGDDQTLPTIAKLVAPYINESDSGYGRVVYDSVNKLYSYNGQKPNIQGSIHVTVASVVDLEIVSAYFTDLQITYNILALTFEDITVATLLLMYDSTGDGYLTIQEIQGITNFNGLFLGQPIVKFNELAEFPGITTLATGQFNGCTQLEEIVLPKNLVTLGNGSFYDCVSLEKVVLPVGITAIGTVGAGNGVFENCASLVNINLGNIITVGSKAFKNALDYNGGIPANVQTIGDEAYYGCSSMTGDLILPASLTALGTSAFQGAGYDGSLNTGSGLTVIPVNAFKDAGFTGDLTIPHGTTTIGANAFAGCQFAGALNLPASLTTVDATSINGLTQLTELNLAVGYDLDVYSNFEFANFSAASVLQSILNCQDGTSESPKELKISFEVYQALLGLDPNVFLDAELRYINVSNIGFVQFIAPETFLNPAQFASFGEDMNIYEAYNEYPDVNKKYAYTVAPATASTVLTAVTGRSYAYKQDDGIMTDYVVLASGTITWTAGSSKRHVIVCNTNASENIANKEAVMSSSWIYVGKNCVVSSIKDSSTTKYLHTYTSVTSIGGSAFQNCSGFTGSLTIPDSVTSIGGSAFQNCSGLTSLTIPDSVTTIGNGAFWNCTGFTGSLTIPNSVTSIGGNAFSGCKFNAITSTNTKYPSYDNVLYAEVVGGFDPILNATEYVGTLTFREDTKSIGSLGFTKRTGSLTIPDSVTSIGANAFSGCTGLLYITLPKPSLISLANTNAFTGTTNLIIVGQGQSYATDKALYDQYVVAVHWSSLKDRLRTNFGVFNGTPLSLALDTSVAAIYTNLYGFDIDGDGIKTLSDESFEEVASCVTTLGTSLKGTTISGSQSLTSLGLDKFTNLTSISGLFTDCPNLTSLDLSNWDLSKCTNLGSNYIYGVFLGTPITNLNVSGWILNTNNSITNFYLFRGLDKITSLDLSTWNTSKVTNLRGTFSDCKSLTSLDVSTWDTSKVITFSGPNVMSCFYNCNSLTSLDLRSWSTESAIEDERYISEMFSGCGALTSFRVSYKFFLTPALQISYLARLTAWVDVTQITEMLNALPDATGNPTRTLMLSTNTKKTITNNNLGSIASTKNWTII